MPLIRGVHVENECITSGCFAQRMPDLSTVLSIGHSPASLMAKERIARASSPIDSTLPCTWQVQWQKMTNFIQFLPCRQCKRELKGNKTGQKHNKQLLQFFPQYLVLDVCLCPTFCLGSCVTAQRILVGTSFV